MWHYTSRVRRITPITVLYFPSCQTVTVFFYFQPVLFVHSEKIKEQGANPRTRTVQRPVIIECSCVCTGAGPCGQSCLLPQVLSMLKVHDAATLTWIKLEKPSVKIWQLKCSYFLTDWQQSGESTICCSGYRLSVSGGLVCLLSQIKPGKVSFCSSFYQP